MENGEEEKSEQDSNDWKFIGMYLACLYICEKGG